MRLVEHTVIIRGPAVGPRGVNPVAAGAVLQRLQQTLHAAVDMVFLQRSVPGRRQLWLQRAGAAELRGVQRVGDAEMALYFDSPDFRSAAHAYYEQPRLWNDGPDPDATAFDVLAEAASDVLEDKSESNRFDEGLLKHFSQFRRDVFGRGVSELEITGRHITRDAPCLLSKRLPEQALAMVRKTPPPAKSRIAGRLDMIQASTLAFELLLPRKQRVRGVYLGRDFEKLREFANSDVVVSGMAVYRPSGGLLRIDAELLHAQQPGDAIFATVPVPVSGKLDRSVLMREQHKRGGVAAMWGKLAADERDEDFLAAVAEMG